MSTSKLQKAVGAMLDSAFPEYNVKENHRPEWLLSSNLTRLELDYYIDELKIGFEIQGRQHYEYTPYFHANYEAFEQRKLYDQEKRDLCYGNGVRLVEIFSLMDAIIEIGGIEVSHKEQTIICPGPKRKRKIEKRPKWTSQGVGYKYMADLRTLSRKGDPIATEKEKEYERGQFLRKFNKCKDRGNDTPYFGFNYLGLNDIYNILEEFGILDKIIEAT